MRQLRTITANTFTEAIRQPIYTVGVLVGAVLLVLNLSLAAYSMEPGSGDNKMLIDIGLSTIFLTGLVLAAFSATGAIADEIESKTVLTVVSKPVARPLFVLGKFLGVAAAISVAYVTLAAVFLLTVRHSVLQNAADDLDGPVLAFGLGGAALAFAYATAGNYLYRRPFTSNLVLGLAVAMGLALLGVLVVDPHWDLQSPAAEFRANNAGLVQVVLGLGLIFEAVLMLTAIAVAASTRFGQLMTLLISVGAFFAGIVSNSLSGWVNTRLNLPRDIGVFDSIAAVAATTEAGLLEKAVYLFAKVFYLVIPNLQFFWPADAISQGNSMIHDLNDRFTLAPIGSASLYGLLYVIAALAVAVILFQRREVS